MKSITYAAQPGAEWQSVITGESKGLSGSRGKGANGDHSNEEEDYNRHASGATNRARCLSEDVDEGEPGRIGNSILDIRHAVQVGDDHAKREGDVEQEAPKHTARNDRARIFDFFGHVSNRVRACNAVSSVGEWRQAHLPKTLNMALTEPTKVAQPTLGHPAPLSEKVRKTS